MNGGTEHTATHRGEEVTAEEEVTAKLDAVYADLPSEIDHGLRRAQARSVAEEWKSRAMETTVK